MQGKGDLRHVWSDVAPGMSGQLVGWVTVRREGSAEADGCGGLPAAAVAGRCKLYSITARPCCVRGG